MSDYASIKYSLNSSLGTEKFQPLDKMIDTKINEAVTKIGGNNKILVPKYVETSARKNSDKVDIFNVRGNDGGRVNQLTFWSQTGLNGVFRAVTVPDVYIYIDGKLTYSLYFGKSIVAGYLTYSRNTLGDPGNIGVSDGNFLNQPPLRFWFKDNVRVVVRSKVGDFYCEMHYELYE